MVMLGGSRRRSIAGALKMGIVVAMLININATKPWRWQP